MAEVSKETGGSTPAWRGGKRRWVFLIAGLVVALAVGIVGFWAFRSYTHSYYTIPELKASAAFTIGEQVRVVGKVAQGCVERHTEIPGVSFVLTEGGEVLPVHYIGGVPAAFGPGREMVVEGHMAPQHYFEVAKLAAR